MNFYENVLGFVPVKRPGSFDFSGAWLFNYGVGIHLLQSKNPGDLPKKSEINPRDNHVSFQCESMQLVERRLQDLRIKYLKRVVEEGGVYLDQLFIHDPDGFMIEICNCDNLPVVPLGPTSHACSFQSAINSNIQRNIIPPNPHHQQILKPSLVPQKMLKFGTSNPGLEAEFAMI
jgi:catechol 2,3-dioxygenase-like lactoylglutathione lyase family enzyme